jgi:hypothetical protein
MAFRWGSKTNKWQIKAKLTWHHFEGKINWFGPQKKLSSKESSWFREPRCKIGSNSRIQFTSNESKLVPKNLDLGHPSKSGPNLLNKPCETFAACLCFTCLGTVTGISSCKKIHAQDTKHKETATYSHRGGIWGVAYRTASMVQGLSESLSRCTLARHSKIYISPQICMSPYTWSFVILGIACIPSYSAAPLQTALYQPEFMFGNFQVWPRSVVAQCNPLWLVWSGVNNWSG